MAGKPLCAWVIESAVKAESVDCVYVSTESFEIKQAVVEINRQFINHDQYKNKLKIIDRPDKLANDTASTESVMLHCLEEVDFDALITIQATSPMLTSDDLNQAVRQFKQEKLDSLLSAVVFKRFLWNADGAAINYDPCKRPRRQDFTGHLMENGAFYITDRDLLKKEKCRLGGKIGVYTMHDISAIEIDELSDWAIAEAILKQKVSGDI